MTSPASAASAMHKHWSTRTDGGHRHSNEEWLQKYASEVVDLLPPAATLLDVGCGSCQLTTYLAPYYKQIYAVDFSDAMLDAARERIERLGLKNIHVLSGSAQRIPEVPGSVDIVLSYGVLQYLTPAELDTHLRECRRLLPATGVVCAANIPDARRRAVYYDTKLAPLRLGVAGRLRQWLRLAVLRVKAFFRGEIWDGVGNWFDAAQVIEAARRTGFTVELRESAYYEYRFHALFRPAVAERDPE